MLTQNIQVLGERNPKDELNNINLTRSVRLNDLTQEEMAKLYRRGQTDVSTGSLNQGFKFDYLFDGNAYNVPLDVVAITFDSETQAVVFDCGYSAVYNRYFRVLLTKGTDGTYSWSQRISEVPWLASDELKTVNGQSLVGTGDIEIAAGVESLNGQTGSISLKTVNGNELIGTGDIVIKGGGDATPTGTTLYFTTTDGQTLNANIEAKNSAGTVIEPSLKTPTAWYYDEIVETMGFPSRTTDCNLYSLNGVNVPVRLENAHMEYIMGNCRYADLRKFFTNDLNILFSMFDSSKRLEWVDVSKFNTSKVINMGSMFSRCEVLTSVDLSHFNTSKVINMSMMFFYCRALTSLDLSHFDTSNVKSMGNMFSDCRRLTSLNLSNWDLTNVTNMSGMFDSCDALNTITMKNCSTETVDKIKAALTDAGILDKVQIITA